MVIQELWGVGTKVANTTYKLFRESVMCGQHLKGTPQMLAPVLNCLYGRMLN